MTSLQRAAARGVVLALCGMWALLGVAGVVESDPYGNRMDGDSGMLLLLLVFAGLVPVSGGALALLWGVVNRVSRGAMQWRRVTAVIVAGVAASVVAAVMLSWWPIVMVTFAFQAVLLTGLATLLWTPEPAPGT